MSEAFAGRLVLVPGEAHVERALRGAPVLARPIGVFLRDAVDAVAPERAVATREAVRLAAGAAVDALTEAGELRAPAEATARTRLAAALDRGFGTLRAAGATPAALLDAGPGRAAMLGRSMRWVDERLAWKKLWDPRELGGVVASRLAAGVAFDDATTGSIEVRGMAALDGDSRAALEALHAEARRRGEPGVRIELPRFVDEADDPIAPIAESLERRWAGLPDAPEIAWRDVATRAPRSVVTARDADGEARAAAAAVLDALAEGTPPERVAILVPDLDEARLEPLRAALDDARIPFREPRGRPASAAPEGRVARALLALAAGPVLRDDVLELLRAPALHAGVFTDRAEEQEAARRATALAHRLRSVPVSVDRTGRWLLEGLARAVDNRPDERWMPHALSRLLELPRYLANAPTRRAVADGLLRMFETLRLGKPSRRALAAALKRESGEGGAAALTALGGSSRAAQAVAACVGAWRDGAASVAVEEAAIEVGRAAAELQALFDATGTAPGGAAAAAAAVRIVRPRDVTASEGAFDLVIVVGLEESAFDGDGDEGLVDDGVRHALPAPVRPPSRAELEAAARVELAWALGSAARLVLVHATGTDAEPAPPHRLVRAALAEGAPSRLEPLARIGRGASILDARGAELVWLARGGAPAADVRARVAVESARTAFFLDPNAEPGPFSGSFAASPWARDHAVACLGGATPDAPIAVTAIEALAECPFRGFARRVLRVRRREELGEAADAPERGTLVHRALHAAFEAAAKVPASDLDGALRAARAGAERALLAGASLAPLRAETLARAVDEALAVVEQSLASPDPLRFVLAERAFGRTQPAPWGALDLGGDPPVFVEGQIDRVDRTADGRRARVVDYKTGSKKPVMDEHGTTRFQLAAYAAVVERALDAGAVEALYVMVRPRGVVEEHPKKAEARAAIVAKRAEALVEARRVVLSAWAGDARPRPADGATCARCEARDVCRRPAVVPDAEAEHA